MTGRRRKAIRVLLISIAASILGLLQQQGYIEKFTSTAVTNQPGLYRVTTFVDGDTITVDMNGIEEKVRLIGVDTPETHDPRKSVQCYGQAASAFTKNFIGANRVRLAADPENINRDKYGRLLRYVYLPSGELVNAEIIKQGFGFAYVYFPFSKMEAFKAYQKQAEQQRLGLWSTCPVNTNQEGQSSTN